ncbi:MAG: HNH endonuclease [Cyclobacteriaceae bacterium]|nr:HNH endonuclease [Cyclobacteriaceae bacterium]
MASNKGRNYLRLTLKKLYALSGNQCAFPNCPVAFLNCEDDINFSNICHIEDANPNTHKADRYNVNMSDTERADYKNLVLLCPNHHIKTNNTEIYTVDVLRKIKRDHEVIIRKRLAGQNIISKYPSVLSTVISQIGSKLMAGAKADEPITAPDPEKKMNYNNVLEYKPIIDLYKVYQGKLSKIYQEIENQGSNRKEFVLKNINTIYLREKGKYKNFEEVKANADDILKNVENKLWEIVENSSNKDDSMPIEAIQMSLLIVMVDAFMRCDILEEPPRNDS